MKVLDEVTYGLVDEDEPISEPTTREDWEAKGSRNTLFATDELLKIVKQVEPGASLRYAKHYIGLEVAGAPRNFVVFRPRKAHIIMEFKLPPQGEETKAMLEDVGLGTLAYDSQFGYYRLRVDPTPNDKQRAALLKLTQQAKERFGK